MADVKLRSDRRLETALLAVFAIGYIGGALSIILMDWLYG